MSLDRLLLRLFGALREWLDAYGSFRTRGLDLFGDRSERRVRRPRPLLPQHVLLCVRGHFLHLRLQRNFGLVEVRRVHPCTPVALLRLAHQFAAAVRLRRQSSHEPHFGKS